MKASARNLKPLLEGRLLAIDPRRLRGLLEVEFVVEEPEGEAEEPAYVTDRGVAIVRVDGVLMAKGSWLSRLFGVPDYESLERAVAELAADPGVRGIVLDVDSPGGQAAGCPELGAALLEARERKPLYAVASGEGAYSAAYWLASAAERIYVGQGGGVGSIGVVWPHVEFSQALADEGVAYTLIHAGAKKVDGNSVEPLSDRARSSMQAEVDRCYGLFVEAVASGRGLEPDAVRATEAGVFYGERAVEAGLADRVGTLADAVADLLEATADAAEPTTHQPFASSRAAGARWGSRRGQWPRSA